jgi:hypothetical protein
MPKMVITHKIEDVDKWLAGKSERAVAIGDLGGRNIVDHVAEDGSTVIAVTFDVDDVSAVTAALASPPPEMAEAMQSHGVIPPLTAYVER